MAECRKVRDGKTGMAASGASPWELSATYFAIDSSDTSHSRKLTKR